MPQYNIQLRTDERVWETLQVESEDQGALRLEVARFVGELLRDHADKIWIDQEWRVDVTDPTGLILFVMHLMVTNAAASVPMRR